MLADSEVMKFQFRHNVCVTNLVSLRKKGLVFVTYSGHDTISAVRAWQAIKLTLIVLGICKAVLSGMEEVVTASYIELSDNQVC